MNEISLTGRLPVDSYGPGGFRVDGVWQAGSLIVSPGGLHGFEPPLDPETLMQLLGPDAGVDLVLFGQGAEIAPLAAPLRAWLEQAGIGEIMSTASACRTYNVLLAEDRRVAAVLLAV